MNRVQLKDLVLEQACQESAVQYEDLGLPQELTVWVDPGEVSCRSGGVGGFQVRVQAHGVACVGKKTNPGASFVLTGTGSTARRSVSWRWTAAGELMGSFPGASTMP